MDGRSPEFYPQTPETTDRGFSEKKSARAREGRVMDNSQVKKQKPLSVLKRRLRRLKKLLVRRDRSALPKDPQDLIK